MAKSKDKNKLVDRLTFYTAFIEPLVSLPQVIQIFASRSANDINLVSWIGWQIVSVIWLWYGIVHKSRPIIVYHALFIVIQTLVIIGKLIYG